MCKLVPVLRVIGFVFLVLAIVACLVGFVAPFWIRMPLDDGPKPTTEAPVDGQARAVMEENRESAAAAAGDEVAPGVDAAATTTEASSGLGLGNVGDTLSRLLKNGSYEGLWAKCFHNFTCSCFWQDNFAMEKAFPGSLSIAVWLDARRESRK